MLGVVMLGVVMLGIILLSVVNAGCCVYYSYYYGCPSAECRYTQSQYAECHKIIFSYCYHNIFVKEVATIFIVILGVILPNVVILSFIKMSVLALHVQTNS
jgi:hypothetical protein